MKSMVRIQQVLAMLVLVILFSFLGCKKDTVSPVGPSVVPQKLVLSLSAAPVLQSDVITVSYGGTATITASANLDGSTITSSVKPNEVFMNTAIIKLAVLTENQVVTITTKNGANTDTKVVKIEITPPTADEKMLFGKWKESNAWGYDYAPNDPVLRWREIKLDPLDSTIYTYSPDRKFSYNNLSFIFYIKTVDNEKILVRDKTEALIEEITTDTFQIRIRVNQEQFTAGLRDLRVLYVRVL